MSAENTDLKNPVLAFIEKAFLIFVPLSMIVMLGIVGVAFIGGMKDNRPKEPVVSAAAPSPVAPAEAPLAAVEGGSDASTAATVTPPGASGGGAVDSEVMALGKASYAMCAACHGPDGSGLKVGPALMAPSLVGSEMLLGDPDKSLLVILKGIAKENMDFMGMMAPLGAALDDEKLAAVLTYTRNEWGNTAPPVTVEQTAAARAKFGALDAPAGVKRTEVDSIVEAHK